MPRRTIKMADLFCGCGGTSTGFAHAAADRGHKVELVAVNHWERAVETHAANHPRANHHCEDLTSLDPRKAVPGGKLDILVASPECTHHSVARGGVPMNDQSRASAWCVLRWATALKIDQILIENVPEFVSWGPIGTNGRPLKSRKGETFSAFVTALESLGYRIETRVLNSADHAAATSRRRLFLRAVRGRRPINWPEPTHAERPTPGLFGMRQKWRAAREIINWNLKGKSIYGRKRPLVENTLKRIEAGLKKFGVVEPFICRVANAGFDESRCRSIDQPLSTIHASGGSQAIVEPFLTHITHHGSDNRIHDLDSPLPTITTAKRGELALIDPFLVSFYGCDRGGDSVADPLRTVTTKDRHGLVQPHGVKFDILFRMLEPDELKQGMGFDPAYKITGNREEQVKQIGNAVEVNQAKALGMSMLDVAAA